MDLSMLTAASSARTSAPDPVFLLSLMTFVRVFKFQAKSIITCMFLQDTIDEGSVPGPLPTHDPTRHTSHTIDLNKHKAMIERYKYITASAKVTADPGKPVIQPNLCAANSTSSMRQSRLVLPALASR